MIYNWWQLQQIPKTLSMSEGLAFVGFCPYATERYGPLSNTLCLRHSGRVCILALVLLGNTPNIVFFFLLRHWGNNCIS